MAIDECPHTFAVLVERVLLAALKQLLRAFTSHGRRVTLGAGTRGASVPHPP